MRTSQLRGPVRRADEGGALLRAVGDDRSIEDHALARWRTWKLAEIEARDVRTLYADLRAADLSTSRIRRLRAALSALFATAVEDGLLRFNPAQGVRIPASRSQGPPVDRAKALTREELRSLLAATPDDWRLFFEFLTHTGLRISEAIGLRWQHVELDRAPRVLVREQVYNGKRQSLRAPPADGTSPSPPVWPSGCERAAVMPPAMIARLCSPLRRAPG